MSADFYILEPDSARGDVLLWWRPNSQGYTARIDEAGRYTEECARQHGIAVHWVYAQAATVKIVDLQRLRETGALDEHYLRRDVEDAWRGRPFDDIEAAPALGWSVGLADIVGHWHSTDIHRLAEWKRVAETVKVDEPGDHNVNWPEVTVSLERSTHDVDGKQTDAVVARATIGRIKLSEVGLDRADASANLVAAALVRGPMHRGEPAA